MKKITILLAFIGAITYSIYGQQVTHVDVCVTAPTGQTLYYSITDSGAVVVNPLYDTTISVSYSLLGSLAIPNSINHSGTDYNVVAIDSNCFRNQEGITSVSFGDSLRYIGDQAFLGCSGLSQTVVIIPSNVHYLGFDSFECLCDLTVWFTSSFIPHCEGRVIFGYQNGYHYRRTLDWHSGYYWENSGLLTIIIPHSWGYSLTEESDNAHNKFIYDTVFIGETHMLIEDDSVLLDTTYRVGYPYPIDHVTFSPIEPPYGYHFIGWDDIFSPNGIDTSRVIINEIGKDVYHTAFYEKNVYSIGLLSDSNSNSCITNRFFSSNYLDTITITADEGCHGYYFSHWQDGDTTNPRSFVLTQDTQFIAYYIPRPYALVFRSADTTMGSVDADTVYGVFYDSTDYITAIPKLHYHFLQWELENADYYDTPLYNNPNRFVFTDYWRYEFMENYPKWIARFEIDNHTVSVQADDIAHGAVTGSGAYIYGAPATLTAMAYSGYHFARWSNGTTYNPYTFAVLQDTLLIAIFEAETQGIDDVIEDAFSIYTLGGQIVVETELKDEIGIYNIVGRKVDGGRNTRFDVPSPGVYFVKMDGHPARKVVVIK